MNPELIGIALLSLFFYAVGRWTKSHELLIYVLLFTTLYQLTKLVPS